MKSPSSIGIAETGFAVVRARNASSQMGYVRRCERSVPDWARAARQLRRCSAITTEVSPRRREP
jgi:hypothetical protein